MYLILDTETTGLPDFRQPADAPGQPRVASIAMLFCDDDLHLLTEWSLLIKPDGWEMPLAAGAINGLTTERLAAEGVPIIIPLLAYAAAIDQGCIVVAHNKSFDLKMMRGELRRARMDDRYTRTSSICTMELGKPLCSRGKLTTVYRELCGEPVVDAHTALGDARMCLAVLRSLRDRNVVLYARQPLMTYVYGQDGIAAELPRP